MLIDEGYYTENISDNTQHKTVRGEEKKKKERNDSSTQTQTQNTGGQIQIHYLVSTLVTIITIIVIMIFRYLL